ncbi:hypothetical protein CEXT_502361, partial [Caerostris extrusa]
DLILNRELLEEIVDKLCLVQSSPMRCQFGAVSNGGLLE